MERLLRLLGRAQYVGEGRKENLPDGQALMLCSYLACRDSWVGRDEILGLFWPDEDERAARHRLSQLLYHCRKQAWARELESEGSRLRFATDTDVKLFREALGRGDWDEAVNLHRGELLEGMPLDGPAPFETWLQGEREVLNSGWREAVLFYADKLSEADRFAEASDVLDAVLRQDPFAEDVLLAQMRCLASDGKRDKALKAYRTFMDRLRLELDTEPLEVTTRLADSLRRSGARHSPAVADGRDEASPARRPLPSPLTPFVGRVVELAELTGALHTPEKRLLTLVGPGGVGKSRLSLQVASEQANAFADGAVFVPLAPLPGGEPFLAALAVALDLSPVPSGSPAEWPADRLRERELLLVLDNFEHLTADAGLVQELLEASPQSRVLVTSRAPLGLPGEYLYELGGLDFPSGRPGEIPEAYEAVQLFMRSARRKRSDFNPGPEEKLAIARICQSLQGLPLGLELAANWLRVLSAPEIAAELASNLDLLTADSHDLPDRHRSLRAVFEHSWRLLSSGERDALRRLAVFRGSFSRGAASEVSDVSLEVLLALVNKSLLLRDSGGRFGRHLAVFGFAEEKLHEVREEAAALRNRHAEHFASMVADLDRSLHSGNQERALTAIAEDFENIRAAWRWAVGQQEWRLLEEMVAGVASFCDIRGRFEEGGTLFSEALATLPVDSTEVAGRGLRARILSRRSAMSLRLGRHDEAVADARACLDIATGSGFEAEIAQSHLTLGNVALFRGQYEDSDRHYLVCLDLRRQLHDVGGEANALNNLGLIAFRLGRYAEARAYHEQSLARKRAIGNDQGIAQSLSSLGSIALEVGDVQEAEEHLLASLAMRRAIGDRRGQALCLNNLGALAHTLSDFQRAVTLLEESLTLYNEIGDKISRIRTLANLGAASCALDRHQSSAQYFQEALLAATESAVPPSLVAALAWMGPLLTAHDRQLAVTALSLAEQHPMTGRADAKVARKALAELDGTILADGFEGTAELDSNDSLGPIVQRVIDLLDVIRRDPDTSPEQSWTPG